MNIATFDFAYELGFQISQGYYNKNYGYHSWDWEQ